MTSMFLIAALAAPGGILDGQGGQDAASGGVEPYVALRSGVWASNGFQFEAVTGSIKREIDTHALFSVGLDAGVEIMDNYVVFATYEANLAEGIYSDLAGACLGYRERSEEQDNPAIPIQTTVYAGGIWGRFDVRADGLWDFEDAFGFRAGIALSWRAGRRMTVDLVGEYRLIEFDYEVKPDSGDDKVGGSTVWVGLGLSYRF